MVSCPRCGAACQPHHKFCGSCAAPIAAPAAAPPPAPQAYAPPPAPEYTPPPPPQGYAPPPPAPQGYAPPPPAPQQAYAPPPPVPQQAYAPPPPVPQQAYAPPPAPQGYAPPPPAPQGYAPPPAAGPTPAARCQMGHDIPPGFSYCPQGHPIALDAMQFAGGDPFNPAPQAGYAHAAPQPPAANPYPPPPPAPSYGGVPAPYPPTGAMAPFPGAPPQPGPPPPAPAPMAAPAPEYAPPPPAPAPAPAPQAAPAPAPAPATAGSRRMLAGFLVSFHNDPLGAFFPLYAGANLIGRTGASDDLNIQIGDPATSSNHATLHCDPNAGRVTIEDSGSTNGTFVNDERLAFQGRRDLREGDRVRLGSYTVKLLLVQRG